MPLIVTVTASVSIEEILWVIPLIVVTIPTVKSVTLFNVRTLLATTAGLITLIYLTGRLSGGEPYVLGNVAVLLVQVWPSGLVIIWPRSDTAANCLLKSSHVTDVKLAVIPEFE